MLRPPPRRSPAAAVVGLLLTIPAYILLVTTYVLPAVTTVRWSFQRYNPLRGEATGVGTENYQAAVEDGLGGRFAYGLLLAVLPLVAVAVVAPLLAWTAHRGGRTVRWITRAVLIIPLAAFAPLAVVVSQMLASQDGDPRTPTVRAIFWLGSFAVTVALGATVFLAVLRRRDPARRPWSAAAVVGALALGTVLAVAVQEFTSAAGFRRGDEGPPALAIYDRAFTALRYGEAAVYATLMLLVLMILGIGAGLLIVLSGLRMEVDDRPDPADRGRPPRVLWAVIAGSLLLLVLAAWWFANRHWLGGVTNTSRANVSTGEVLADTWLPPFVSALLGLVVAGLAAFGISGLRPFGRHSEWLLMPFAPFLFVGVTPLIIAWYDGIREDGRIGSFWAAVPPVLVPALLFVLALILRGQALRRETLFQEGRPVTWARTLAPVLPMVAIAFLVTWLVRVHDVLWQSTATLPDLTAPTILRRFASGPPGTEAPYGLLMPVWLLPLLVLIGIAAQLFYLDRVALRAGRPERDPAF
jgi:ABC-type sugar transport system permease subunit